MLLIPVTVGPSPIHGLGVFAARAIAAGEAVWHFTPGFDLELEPAALDALPPLQRDWLRHYGYVDRRLGRFVLCCDDARFLNHSATPNLSPDFTHDRHGIDRALHDIAAGEELTVDYTRFEDAEGLA